MLKHRIVQRFGDIDMQWIAMNTIYSWKPLAGWLAGDGYDDDDISKSDACWHRPVPQQQQRCVFFEPTTMICEKEERTSKQASKQTNERTMLGCLWNCYISASNKMERNIHPQGVIHTNRMLLCKPMSIQCCVDVSACMMRCPHIRMLLLVLYDAHACATTTATCVYRFKYVRSGAVSYWSLLLHAFKRNKRALAHHFNVRCCCIFACERL